MEQVNLGSVIEKSIARFNRNRIGDKPPVFVALTPALMQVPWKDRTLREFLQFFLYESLLTSHPDAAIEISLRRRLLLKELTAFVRIQPSYWVQVRAPAGAYGSPSRWWKIFSQKSAIAAKNGSA